MSRSFEASNPYLSPAYPTEAPPQRERAPGSLVAAGTALTAVACLGLALSGFNFVLTFGEAKVDHGAPYMVQELQRGTVGPVATGIQGGFVMLNLFIIVCGVQMMKMQSWGLGVTGSVLAILNVGSCCCVLGAPVGIWCLSVLMSPDIISLFNTNQMEQQG